MLFSPCLCGWFALAFPYRRQTWKCLSYQICKIPLVRVLCNYGMNARKLATVGGDFFMEMEGRCWGISSLGKLLVMFLKYCDWGIIANHVSACSYGIIEYNKGTMMFQLPRWLWVEAGWIFEWCSFQRHKFSYGESAFPHAELASKKVLCRLEEGLSGPLGKIRPQDRYWGKLVYYSVS